MSVVDVLGLFVNGSGLQPLDTRIGCNVILELDHTGINDVMLPSQVHKCSRYGTIGCKNYPKLVNDDFNEAGRGIPGIPDVDGEWLSPFDTLPDGYEEKPPGSGIWVKKRKKAEDADVNGEYGAGKEEFIKFIEEAWQAAVNEAKALCKKNCRCKFINVEFRCGSDDSIRIMKQAGLESYCNRRIGVPCDEPVDDVKY